MPRRTNKLSDSLTAPTGVGISEWLGELSDHELNQLAEGIWRERTKREEAKCKRDNICPECMGTGFLGSETDHEPCDRCKTTGRYSPNEKGQPQPPETGVTETKSV